MAFSKNFLVLSKILVPSCHFAIQRGPRLWHHMTYERFSMAASKSGMVCVEKRRLQELYDAANRRWAQIQASSQLFGQATYMRLEVKERALVERNAAKARLTMHEQNCKRCHAPSVTRAPEGQRR